MLIVRNIKMPIDTDFNNLKQEICKILKVDGIKSVRLYKKSIDARKKEDIIFNCAVLLQTENDCKVLKSLKTKDAEIYNEQPYVFKKVFGHHKRPVVVGFGPCGMFAALSLAKAGLNPIVLERGRDVDSRIADVNSFFETNELDVNSNIQFGEGGAGTFSDGKLNTGIKDKRIRAVLEILAFHGAGESILYDAKPHIGTDVLVRVVKSIRKEIIKLGGEVLFCHRLTGINTVCGRLKSVTAETPDGAKEFECDRVILSIGHSARDTFLMLQKMGIIMQPKPFAVGTRIEHSQELIDSAQYGRFSKHPNLSAADYKLATRASNGRGVFTFCMCPGGEVVNASSEKGRVAVNGMSNSARDGRNANSAVLCDVRIEDYFKGDALDGMYFQRNIEEKAFAVGKGLPVSQSLGDFLKSGVSDGKVTPTAKSGVTFGEINKVLPSFIIESLCEGIVAFDRKIKGFASPSAVLTAPETRSSSPVRILRNDKGQASTEGIYPAGEGAGYAGGITSAAVDGLKVAETITEELNSAISDRYRIS